MIFWNFWIFFGFFLIPFKVTKVTSKSYQGYYWAPKIVKNEPKQHKKLFCFVQRAKKKPRPKPSVGSGFPGVPLENFSSICTGALFKFRWSSTEELKFHWGSWGCFWTWLSYATAKCMSRSPNSWMRQCLESELDGEFFLVADPSQCKSTPGLTKFFVTFKHKLHPKIFVPTSSFLYNFEFNFGTIWPRSSPNCLCKSIFSKVPLAKIIREGYA